MTFQATVLATLIGACTGAIVGALAAWLFAFDLRRRERVDAGRTRLDAAVADVVRLLGEFSGAAQSFAFSVTLSNPAVPASPPHLPRQRLLSAVLAARMAAGDDEEPLIAVYDLVTRVDDRTPSTTAIHYEHAAHALVQWRQGKRSTSEAKGEIVRGRPTTSQPSDS